ncbi:MAG: hypothetical protein RL120_05805, partial [Gammaproteobacteria bacterium]
MQHAVPLRTSFIAALVFGLAACSAQDPQDSAAVGWAQYRGDYQGRGYSELDQIDAGNVSRLALSWEYELSLPVEDRRANSQATAIV